MLKTMGNSKNYLYLECSNEKSHKFYELKKSNTTISATFGRIGTKGAKKNYHFKNTTEKEIFYLKILTAKTKKGYTEAVKGQRIFIKRNINPKQLQIPFY